MTTRYAAECTGEYPERVAHRLGLALPSLYRHALRDGRRDVLDLIQLARGAAA